MKLYALFAGAALMLSGCVVVTEDDQMSTAPAPAEAVAEAPAAEEAAGEEQVAEQEVREERICRRERVTGSNRPRRVCYTRTQYEQMQEDAQETMHRRGNTCYNCGGGD